MVSVERMLKSMLSVLVEACDMLCAVKAVLTPRAWDLNPDDLLRPLSRMCNLINPNLSGIQFPCFIISFRACTDIDCKSLLCVPWDSNQVLCTLTDSLQLLLNLSQRLFFFALTLKCSLLLLHNSLRAFTTTTIASMSESVRCMLVMWHFL